MSQVTAFFEKLREPAFRARLAPRLVRVPEGDWEGITHIAADAGFEFSPDELKRAMPEGFFRGRGKRPGAGWSSSTREG